MWLVAVAPTHRDARMVHHRSSLSFLALTLAPADMTGLPLLVLFFCGRAQVLYHNTLEEMSILGDGLVRITGAGRGEKLLQFFRKVRAGPLFFLRGSKKRRGDVHRQLTQELTGAVRV